MRRRILTSKIWKQKRYFEKIREKEDFSHPGFLLIKGYCQNATTILDVGSGDGGKLSMLGNERTMRVGSDISLEGLTICKSQHSKMKLVVCEGEHLPFADNLFDRVTCMFVLEHTHSPEKLVSEVMRVTKKGGLFFFLAPNFGAPNRASPNFRGSRLIKFVRGFIKDFIDTGDRLGWEKVEPNLESIEEFESDQDTTIEPYLLSLIRFINRFPIGIVKTDSFWEMELPHPKLWQTINRLFGAMGIFPFKYWGPHIFVGARKLQ